ncbi:MAG: type II toxin-antitoxin system HicA family toxin [Lachnospiraceae bacterium]|nr:type II toxin-antitoxin system HicA family toxin [Lachnospiraceae bacterium]
MNTDFRTIERKVTADGWMLVRTRGSHFQFKKEGVPQTVVIPNHGGRDISPGVVRHLEKITGLSLRG